MRQNPAQGIEDFDSLQEYVREWIQPCLLGDLRRLVAALEHDFGPADAQGRPYGAGKFMALQAVLTAGRHIGALVSPLADKFHEVDYDPYDPRVHLRSLLALLGGNYRRYRHVLTEFGYAATRRHLWPATMLRFGPKPSESADEDTDSTSVELAFGLGVCDFKPNAYPNFSVHRFEFSFPQVGRTLGMRTFDLEWTRQPVIAIRLFIDVIELFHEIDDFCFGLTSRRLRRSLESNFRDLQAYSVWGKNFPTNPPDHVPEEPYGVEWHPFLLKELENLSRRAKALKGRPAKPRPRR